MDMLGQSQIQRNDLDFQEEFEADDTLTPEVFGNTYLNINLAIPRGGDGPEFAKVTKRLRDNI